MFQYALHMVAHLCKISEKNLQYLLGLGPKYKLHP